MSGKAIVLDANILIRAVMGKRVRELIFDNVLRCLLLLFSVVTVLCDILCNCKLKT